MKAVGKIVIYSEYLSWMLIHRSRVFTD